MNNKNEYFKIFITFLRHKKESCDIYGRHKIKEQLK